MDGRTARGHHPRCLREPDAIDRAEPARNRRAAPPGGTELEGRPDRDRHPTATDAAIDPVLDPEPTLIPFVPVVGFWSTKPGISGVELEAALAGRSRRYRRVLAAGAVAGATRSTPALIREAVNADPGTLGLLPAEEVTADVHALAVDGLDLFGNDRLRDLATWPLLVPAPTDARP